MAKEISEWKKYIREAKTRLQDNYYNIFGEDTYYLNNSYFSKREESLWIPVLMLNITK